MIRQLENRDVCLVTRGKAVVAVSRDCRVKNEIPAQPSPILLTRCSSDQVPLTFSYDRSSLSASMILALDNDGSRIPFSAAKHAIVIGWGYSSLPLRLRFVLARGSVRIHVSRDRRLAPPVRPIVLQDVCPIVLSIGQIHRCA